MEISMKQIVAELKAERRRLAKGLAVVDGLLARALAATGQKPKRRRKAKATAGAKVKAASKRKTGGDAVNIRKALGGAANDELKAKRDKAAALRKEREAESPS